MRGRRKTPEEEEAILNNIEEVAEDLSEQVGELQSFLRELRKTRAQGRTHLQEASGGTWSKKTDQNT